MNEVDTAYDVISDATRRAIRAGRATGDRDPMKVVDYVIGCLLARVETKISARPLARQRVSLTSEQLVTATRMREEGAYLHEIAVAFGFDGDLIKPARHYLAKRLVCERGGAWWRDSNALRARGESFDDYRARARVQGLSP